MLASRISGCALIIATTLLSGTRGAPSSVQEQQVVRIFEKAGTVELSDEDLEILLGSRLSVRQQREPDVGGYAVVIDCGSSGSRAHIYRRTIERDSAGNQVKAVVEPMRSMNGAPINKRIRPGLSSVRDNPEAASDYMKPLMDFVAANLPEQERARTPIYFMATAGLRQLSKLQQQRILEDIAIDTRIDYGFEEIYTEVLTGADEGINLWLSVNSNGNRLGTDYDQSEAKFHCQAPLSRRYGIIEMGGASVQVTFEVSHVLDYYLSAWMTPHGDARRVYKDSISEHVKLGLGESQREVRVFSTTFLNFGSESARELEVDLLIKEKVKQERLNPFSSRAQYSAGSTITVDDPCMPLGAEDTTRRPLSIIHNDTKTLGYNLVPSDRQSISVRLVGKGNFFLCRKLLYRMLLIAKQEKFSCERGDLRDCSVLLLGTPFVPFRFIQFLGLGDLFYTTKEMINGAGRVNPPYVAAKTAEICATPYMTLMDKYPEANRNDQQRVLRECFKATWVLTLLQFGFQMPMNFVADFQTLDSLDGGRTQLDWTRGALLRRIYDPPSESLFML